MIYFSWNTIWRFAFNLL